MEFVYNQLINYSHPFIIKQHKVKRIDFTSMDVSGSSGSNFCWSTLIICSQHSLASWENKRWISNWSKQCQEVRSYPDIFHSKFIRRKQVQGTWHGCISHLLEVLSLVPLLSKLWKGHVKELQQNDGWQARWGLFHGLIQVTKGWGCKDVYILILYALVSWRH